MDETKAPIILKNNTLVDPVTKKFMRGSKPTTAITSATGKVLGHRRAELAKAKARKEIAAAVAEGTGRPDISATDAYGIMAGEAAKSYLANSMDKPREAKEIGKFALQLGGMMPTEDREQIAGARATLDLTPEALSMVADILARHRDKAAQSIDMGSG